MVSIIVPVYNVERYIKHCIESILSQSYTDWELILIDDGSTDSSGLICEQFASKDNRILYIHKTNGGVTEARRIGWENSHGEWVTFVDGDDTLPRNSLATLFEKTRVYDTDIIEGYSFFRNHLPQITDINDYRQCLLKGVDKVSVTVWGKLFRREILNKWCFDIPRTIVRGEDWIMNLRIAFMSKKAPILIPNKVYNYTDNSMSLSHIHSKDINYEYTFFQYWRDSIPNEKDNYSFYIVRIAILMYVGICVQNLSNVEVVDTPFAKEIIQMKTKIAYPLKYHQKVLLLSKSQWLRKFAWSFHCLKERILNSF